MPTIFDHISAKSKTAIRKTLRASLEEQFAHATSLVDDLCGKRTKTNLCAGVSTVRAARYTKPMAGVFLFVGHYTGHLALGTQQGQRTTEDNVIRRKTKYHIKLNI